MQTGGGDQTTAHDRPASATEANDRNDRATRPVPRWRWLASGAPLVPVLATMPWLHAQDPGARWVAWGLGVIGGVTLLTASAIATRRARR